MNIQAGLAASLLRSVVDRLTGGSDAREEIIISRFINNGYQFFQAVYDMIRMVLLQLRPGVGTGGDADNQAAAGIAAFFHIHFGIANL